MNYSILYIGKKWVLWIELAANDKCEATIALRKKQGFSHIEKVMLYFSYSILFR